MENEAHKKFRRVLLKAARRHRYIKKNTRKARIRELWVFFYYLRGQSFKPHSERKSKIAASRTNPLCRNDRMVARPLKIDELLENTQRFPRVVSQETEKMLTASERKDSDFFKILGGSSILRLIFFFFSSPTEARTQKKTRCAERRKSTVAHNVW